MASMDILMRAEWRRRWAMEAAIYVAPISYRLAVFLLGFTRFDVYAGSHRTTYRVTLTDGWLVFR